MTRLVLLPAAALAALFAIGFAPLATAPDEPARAQLAVTTAAPEATR